MRIGYHRRALAEAEHAVQWYAGRSIGAARRLAEELEDAEAKMLSQAELCPKYHRGTRYVQLRRFPYLVVFRQQNETFQTIAVAHAKRRPFYWARRLDT